MRALDIVVTEGLPAVRVITPRRHRDIRGFFSEVWRQDAMTEAGIDVRFVQENHAASRATGTIRGLHFQIGDAAQAKLVRCPRGSIFDVAVDIRHGSPTFGRHTGIVLSAENWKQLYVPEGFAHGYCTLESDTEVMYKVTAYYDPASERGLAWDDPALGIAWPVSPDRAVLTERDRTFPGSQGFLTSFPLATIQIDMSRHIIVVTGGAGFIDRRWSGCWSARATPLSSTWTRSLANGS